jgi:hypothetical protein
VNINSSMNLAGESTRGILPPPVSGTPAPRCLSELPSFLERFQKGKICTRSRNAALIEHILPVFTSSRASQRMRRSR